MRTHHVLRFLNIKPLLSLVGLCTWTQVSTDRNVAFSFNMSKSTDGKAGQFFFFLWIYRSYHVIVRSVDSQYVGISTGLTRCTKYIKNKWNAVKAAVESLGAVSRVLSLSVWEMLRCNWKSSPMAICNIGLSKVSSCFLFGVNMVKI